jgi:hypothetical protein
MSRSDLTLPNKAADGVHRLRLLRILSQILLSGVASIAFAGFTATASEAPTEAPAGFDTPTLVKKPGSQSTNNGITEPPGDTFVLDQQNYETTEDVTTGLGPLYNAETVELIIGAPARFSVKRNWKRRRSSLVVVSGDRPRNLVSFITVRM